MRVVNRIHDLRAELDHARAQGGTVGVVPTMGALHEGHASLIRRSVAECDVTAVTVFVNPLQFGPADDLDAYPRDLGRDADVAGDAGAAFVFAPDVAEMYPEPPSTTVEVGALGSRHEGSSRPGHFAGMATVVAKLFNAAGPCRAYFGEKDYQQLLIVRRMARDLSFPVDVVGCPTVRETDGLALSSRNAYLDAADRPAASVLYRALNHGVSRLEAGERDAATVEREMAGVIESEPRARLDYVAVVSAGDLEPVEQVSGEVRLLAAAWVGPTRLIDNVAALRDGAAHEGSTQKGSTQKGSTQKGSTAVRRRMMKSKIHRAQVTGTDLDYEGSISLDRELMVRADILEWEQVAVLDIDNGARFETYAIAGEAGQVQLNGAAARLVDLGDRVIVLTYADYDDAELAGYQPIVLHVDGRNRPRAPASARA